MVKRPTSPGCVHSLDDRRVLSVPVVLRVRSLTADEHLSFIASRGSASFLQTPAWAQTKREWSSESIGWIDQDNAIVGAGLVLYRQLPRVPRSLAYLPEGPLIDWADADMARWLSPLTSHVSQHGAFGIRMGPPVVTRRWSAQTLKEAIAEGRARRLDDVPADEVDKVGTRLVEQLTTLGWRPPHESGGFALGQPRHTFQLPLAGHDQDSLLRRMNQLWRRNIKKAQKAGVEVRLGDVDDLAAFHQLYVETAQRDNFTPRPLSYFQTMVRALSAESPERVRLYLAHHDGDLVAATIAVQVGHHVWYSYGASSSQKRDVRASNAVQWRMICDAADAGGAGVRPAWHYRHPGSRRSAVWPDPVQAGNRR